jgi:hypothetical protein
MIKGMLKDRVKDVHLFQDKTNMQASPKENFRRIYDSMFHGSGSVSYSSIHDERIKMGDNLKAMGKMTHRSSTESVRKVETRMGNIKDLQIEDTPNQALPSDEQVEIEEQ